MDPTDLRSRMIAGCAAGMAGAAALNIATYLDMLTRGRAASSVPKKDVRELESAVSLPEPGDRSARQERSHRETAAGALIGYLVGIGTGMVTGASWPVLRLLPRPLAGVLVGGGAMAGSDIPSVALGTTDPRSWGPASWAADIVPHLVYGLVTVALTGTLLSRDR